MIPPRDGVAASITASSQDLPLGRRTPSREPLAFRIMAWSVFLVAVGVLAAGLLRDPGLLSNQPAILAAWTALVSLAGLISVSLGPGMELAVDLPLLLAAAYLWGPIVGGLVSLIG